MTSMPGAAQARAVWISAQAEAAAVNEAHVDGIEADGISGGGVVVPGRDLQRSLDFLSSEAPLGARAITDHEDLLLCDDRPQLVLTPRRRAGSCQGR